MLTRNMKRLSLKILLLSLLAACSGEADKRPNVILVTVDTLRWDYLATYGFPEKDVSPAADRLAQNGLVFDQAVSNVGTTIPSHGSMLTGLYARMHGARSNFHGLYPGINTVTEALRDEGYQTGAFISNQFLLKIGGLGLGFEATNTPFKDLKRGARPQSGNKTVTQSAGWLDTLSMEEPVFIWLHLWEPHGPYDLTDRAVARLGDYDGFLKDGVTIKHTRHRVSEIVNSPGNVAALRSIYSGEVNLADQYLGQFLDDLDIRDLLSNSVVIFAADHGQSLGENKRMGHGPTHRETVLRVPLIVADFRSNRTGRIKTRVGTIDIAPTIAAAAGLEKTFDYVGRSLLNPEALEEDWPYFAEVAVRRPTDRNWERTRDSTTYDAEALAVYTGPFKLTYRNGHYKLFETGKWLLVARPLNSEHDAIMADYLQGLIESFRETDVDLTAGEVSEEDLKALQGLGYTQ